MNQVRRALVALLVGLAGCTTAPTLAEREASFEPFESRAVGATTLRNFILARTALVLGGLDEEQKPLLHFNGAAVIRFGAAAALTSDGYFLTVAHCLKKNEPVWLAVPVKGESTLRWAPVRGRVVWSGDPEVLDLALLKVDVNLVAAFDWADPASVVVSGEVANAGFGATRDSTSNDGWQIGVIGGRALEVHSPSRPAPDGPSIAVVDYEGPIWRGDSGGALTTLTGDLLGVTDCIVVSGFSRWNVALRPDPRWIAEAIERDRRALTH